MTFVRREDESPPAFFLSRAQALYRSDSPPESLATARLVLRRPKLSDAAGLYQYGRDPEVVRYVEWRRFHDIRDATDFIQRCESRWESAAEYLWIVALKPYRTPIGHVACRVRGHVADFDCALMRNYWAHGYATEACRPVLGWAGGLVDVHRIAATCDVDDAAGMRLLEKLGLTREGVLRRWSVRPNFSSQPRDACSYARVRED